MISILINPLALINSHAGETFGSGPPGGFLMLGLLNASGKQWSSMRFERVEREERCFLCGLPQNEIIRLGKYDLARCQIERLFGA